MNHRESVIGKCPFCIEEEQDGQEFDYSVQETRIDGKVTCISRQATCFNCYMIFVQVVDPDDGDDEPDFLPNKLQFEQEQDDAQRQKEEAVKQRILRDGQDFERRMDSLARKPGK